ncbi:MAG: hypothetical protein LBF88_03050 [Planctomycetaceae bacterium]|nr:hypothetical protein [Planctomycetaceae bacterium]
MSQKYLLPCSCGRSCEIETVQAGQMITCTCGQTQQVPSLLKIRNLPVAEEKKTDHSERSKPKPETGKMRQVFFLLGVIFFLPAVIFFIWALFSYPLPRDVSRKQEWFSYGSTKLLYQNSTPIPDFEHTILLIRNEDFDQMNPMELYFYFKILERGPNFSYNFQENYQALRDAYHIRVAAGAVVLFLVLMSFTASFFMPKRDVIVTGWSGSEWK